MVFTFMRSIKRIFIWALQFVNLIVCDFTDLLIRMHHTEEALVHSIIYDNLMFYTPLI